MDSVQTIYTHIKTEGDLAVFPLDHQGGIDLSREMAADPVQVARRFNTVSKERKKTVDSLGLFGIAYLPNFNEGAESLLPRKEPVPEETVKNIIQFTEAQAKRENPDYIQVTFEKKDIIYDGKASCLVQIPGSFGDSSMDFWAIDKKDMEVAEDGVTYQAFVKQEGMSPAKRYDSRTKRAADISKKNKELYREMEVPQSRPVRSSGLTEKDLLQLHSTGGRVRK